MSLVWELGAPVTWPWLTVEVSLIMFLKQVNRRVPWWLVVRVPGIHPCGWGSVPEWGTEIPKATQLSKKRGK